MKLLKLTSVIVLMVFIWSNCYSQLPRNEMIYFYKESFLYNCTESFELAKDYRDEVCTYSMDWIDKRSLVEIDSMGKLVGDEIRFDVQIINQESSGDSFPSRICVLHYCLKKYESEDLKKLAKGFARRMKKISPHNYHLY